MGTASLEERICRSSLGTRLKPSTTFRLQRQLTQSDAVQLTC